MRIRPFASMLLCLCSVGWADTIRLNNGKTVEGELRWADKGWEVRLANGQVITVPESEVASVEIGAGKGTGKQSPAERLVLLRKSVDMQGEVSITIKRYEMFLKDPANAAAVKDAQADLDLWKSRLAAGFARVGGKWLDKVQLTQLDAKNAARVGQAKAMLKQGRQTDAGSKLDTILAEDPEHVGALYLKAIVFTNQNQAGQARKSFEQVIALRPDHGPTLNNAAVMQWRTRGYPQAMLNMDKAMVVMPLTPRIHDNVAEALNDLPREVRNSTATKRLTRRYTETEPELERLMARSGWYRWGSTWVQEKELERLKAQEIEVKGKLVESARDVEDTLGVIDRIDALIEADNRAISAIEAGVLVRDSNGNVVRLAYPPGYFQFLRDVDRLSVDRKTALRKLDGLHREAEQVRSQLAVAPYSGQMRLMDEDYCPAGVRDVAEGLVGTGAGGATAAIEPVQQ